MAQLIPARSFVIVPEEYVIVQVLQAVPTKRVLAVLTHHLGAAFVALNVDAANRALLDGGVRIRPKEGPMLWHRRLAVSAGGLLMPSILAT